MDIFKAQFKANASVKDDGKGNVSISLSSIEAPEKSDVLGGLTAAGLCADNKLLRAFAAGVCKGRCDAGEISEGQKNFITAGIVSYVVERRAGKNEKELLQILSDAVSYYLQKDNKRASRAIQGTADNVSLIKIPNTKISKVQAAGLANVRKTLSPDAVQSLFIGTVEDKPIETKYIFIPKDPENVAKDPATAFYDSCVECAWCSIWAAYRKPVKMSIYNAYAVFTGADARARRTGTAGKGAAKYERFAAACIRLANDSVYADASAEAKKRQVYFIPQRVPLRYPIEDKEIGGGVVKAGVSSFIITEAPFALQYAEIHGQVISKEKRYFDIVELYDKHGKPLPMGKRKMKAATERGTLIKYYLLRRVFDIVSGTNAGKANINRFIVWEKMLLLIGESDSSPKVHKACIEFALLVLDNWILQGVFSGYKRKTKGAEGVELLN